MLSSFSRQSLRVHSRKVTKCTPNKPVVKRNFGVNKWILNENSEKGTSNTAEGEPKSEKRTVEHFANLFASSKGKAFTNQTTDKKVDDDKFAMHEFTQSVFSFLEKKDPLRKQLIEQGEIIGTDEDDIGPQEPSVPIKEDDTEIKLAAAFEEAEQEYQRVADYSLQQITNEYKQKKLELSQQLAQKQKVREEIKDKREKERERELKEEIERIQKVVSGAQGQDSAESKKFRQELAKVFNVSVDQLNEFDDNQIQELMLKFGHKLSSEALEKLQKKIKPLKVEISRDSFDDVSLDKYWGEPLNYYSKSAHNYELISRERRKRMIQRRLADRKRLETEIAEESEMTIEQLLYKQAEIRRKIQDVSAVLSGIQVKEKRGETATVPMDELLNSLEHRASRLIIDDKRISQLVANKFKLEEKLSESEEYAQSEATINEWLNNPQVASNVQELHSIELDILGYKQQTGQSEEQEGQQQQQKEGQQSPNEKLKPADEAIIKQYLKELVKLARERGEITKVAETEEEEMDQAYHLLNNMQSKKQKKQQQQQQQKEGEEVTEKDKKDAEELAEIKMIKKDLKEMQLHFDILKFKKEKEDYEGALNRFRGLQLPAPGLNDLKYWNVYPKQIKRWVLFTKAEQGYYDEDGYWVYTKDDIEDDEVTHQNVAREVKGLPKMTQGEEQQFRANFRKRLPSIYGPSGEGSDAHMNFDRTPPELTAMLPMPLTEDIPKDTAAELLQLEKLFLAEQKELAPDLRSEFRFGVTWEEVRKFHPKVRRLFSFKNATQGEILSFRKRKAVEKWRRHAADTASPAIQVEILTHRIRSLNQHLKNNKQDKDNMRSRDRLIKRRKGWMKQLKRDDIHMYFAVLRSIRLRDVAEVYKIHPYK